MDKYKNKQYEINRLNDKFLSKLNNFKNYPVNIFHVDSFNYRGIQVADLISWSIYQSVEYKNREFIDLIDNKYLKKVFED